MDKPMSALDRLRSKHKSAAAAKAQAVQAQTAKGINPAPKNIGVPTNVKGTIGVLTESCVGTNLNLANMLNKTKANTVVVDAIEAKIQKRQDDGLYTAPTGLESLDGAAGKDVMDKLRELDHALIAKTPDIGILTIKIRKNLEQYAELTHILNDAQLGIICSGILHTANIATEPKTKQGKSAAETKKIKELSSSVDASMI